MKERIALGRHLTRLDPIDRFEQDGSLLCVGHPVEIGKVESVSSLFDMPRNKPIHRRNVIKPFKPGLV
jgi:hypothetical protein